MGLRSTQNCPWAHYGHQNRQNPRLASVAKGERFRRVQGVSA